MGGEAGAGDVGAQRADGEEDDRPAVDLRGRGVTAAAAGAAPAGRDQRQGGEERGGVDGGGEAGRAPQPAPPARG